MDTETRPTEVVYVRLARDLKERMRQLADRRHGGNMAALMRFLMDDYLNRIDADLQMADQLAEGERLRQRMIEQAGHPALQDPPDE